MAAWRIASIFRKLVRRPTTGAPSNGRQYEALARRWYRQHGYRVVSQNCRIGGVEVDLIAVDRRGQVRIVEVRGAGIWTYRPVHTLSPWKIQRLRHAARVLSRSTGEAVRLEFMEIRAGGPPARWEIPAAEQS